MDSMSAVFDGPVMNTTLEPSDIRAEGSAAQCDADRKMRSRRSTAMWTSGTSDAMRGCPGPERSFRPGDSKLAVHVSGVVLDPSLGAARCFRTDPVQTVGELVQTVDAVGIPAHVIVDLIAVDDFFDDLGDRVRVNLGGHLLGDLDEPIHEVDLW